MSARERGTVHLYGINGRVANATVQNVKLKSEPANRDDTVDENGNVIERRIDDITDEGTVELKMRAAFTVPTAGDTLVYETLNYEITSIDRAEQAKGFRMLTIGVKKSQYVDASAVTTIATS